MKQSAQKVKSANNYDAIASSYDLLSRLVYFRSQVKAQTDQLTFIPENSRILIVGGGTGWILEHISRIRPSGLHITYIEISEKMLDRSRKRDIKDNQITYLQAAAEDHSFSSGYDVIITAFLFDNFSKDKIDHVFHQLDQILRSGGLWLFSDFHYNSTDGKLWQKLMLKAMYFFFRRISKVETDTLISLEPLFRENNYKEIQMKRYYSGFIKAIVYQKS